MNLLVTMIKNLLPPDGRYIVQYGTFDDPEKGKSINVQIADSRSEKMIICIDLYLPK